MKQGRDVDFQNLGLVVGFELGDRIRGSRTGEDSEVSPLQAFWVQLIQTVAQHKNYPVVIGGFLNAMIECGFSDERIYRSRLLNKIEAYEAREVGRIAGITASAALGNHLLHLVREQNGLLCSNAEVLWSVLGGLSVCIRLGSVENFQIGYLQKLLNEIYNRYREKLFQAVTVKPASQKCSRGGWALSVEQKYLGFRLLVQNRMLPPDPEMISLFIRTIFADPILSMSYSDRYLARLKVGMTEVRGALQHCLGISADQIVENFIVLDDAEFGGGGLVVSVAFKGLKVGILVEPCSVMDSSLGLSGMVTGWLRCRQALLIQEGWKIFVHCRGSLDLGGLELFLDICNIYPSNHLMFPPKDQMLILCEMRDAGGVAIKKKIENIFNADCPAGLSLQRIFKLSIYPGLNEVMMARVLLAISQLGIKIRILELIDLGLTDRFMTVLSEYLLCSITQFGPGNCQCFDTRALKRIDISGNFFNGASIPFLNNCISEMHKLFDGCKMMPLEIGIVPGNKMMMKAVTDRQEEVDKEDYAALLFKLSSWLEQQSGVMIMDATSNLEVLKEAWGSGYE